MTSPERQQELLRQQELIRDNRLNTKDDWLWPIDTEEMYIRARQKDHPDRSREDCEEDYRRIIHQLQVDNLANIFCLSVVC